MIWTAVVTSNQRWTDLSTGRLLTPSYIIRYIPERINYRYKNKVIPLAGKSNKNCAVEFHYYLILNNVCLLFERPKNFVLSKFFLGAHIYVGTQRSAVKGIEMIKENCIRKTKSLISVIYIRTSMRVHARAHADTEFYKIIFLPRIETYQNLSPRLKFEYRI